MFSKLSSEKRGKKAELWASQILEGLWIISIINVEVRLWKVLDINYRRSTFHEVVELTLRQVFEMSYNDFEAKK